MRQTGYFNIMSILLLQNHIFHKLGIRLFQKIPIEQVMVWKK